MNRLLARWLAAKSLDPEEVRRELDLIDLRLDVIEQRLQEAEKFHAHDGHPPDPQSPEEDHARHAEPD